jgi:predicted nucleic acid-binding protein
VNYLLDTNVISELRKGPRCDPSVGRWYASVPEDNIYLSVLVIGEIRNGIERLRVRDPLQAEILEKWLDAVKETSAGRVLLVDEQISQVWGRLGAVRPLPIVDGLLLATAKIHGMTLVTRDMLDTRNLGVRVLNPFEPR